MAKKIIGIILIVLGSYCIVMTAINVIALSKTSREERIQKDTKEFTGLTIEEIESIEDSQHRFTMNFLIIAPIIGGGLLWGGLVLFKSGKKQSEYNKSLKKFN